MLPVMKIRISVPANHRDNVAGFEFKREFITSKGSIDYLMQLCQDNGYIVEGYSINHIMLHHEIMEEISKELEKC